MNSAEATSTQVSIDANDVGSFNTTGIVGVTFTAGQGFIDTLQLLQKLCLENDLTQARRWFTADHWTDSEGDAADEAVEGECLVVTTDSFWLRCCVEEDTYVESEEVNIAGFLEGRHPHQATQSEEE